VSVTTVTHLNFRGDARSALEFYQSVSGGELAIITYKDMGNIENPDEADQVVWGQVTAANGFHIMAYDVPASRPWSRGDDPFFISLRGNAPTRSPPCGRGSPTAPPSSCPWPQPSGPRFTGCSRTATAPPGDVAAE
jgi:hypothetical protein